MLLSRCKGLDGLILSPVSQERFVDQINAKDRTDLERVYKDLKFRAEALRRRALGT